MAKRMKLINHHQILVILNESIDIGSPDSSPTTNNAEPIEITIFPDFDNDEFIDDDGTDVLIGPLNSLHCRASSPIEPKHANASSAAPGPCHHPKAPEIKPILIPSYHSTDDLDNVHDASMEKNQIHHTSATTGAHGQPQ